MAATLAAACTAALTASASSSSSSSPSSTSTRRTSGGAAPSTSSRKSTAARGPPAASSSQQQRPEEDVQGPFLWTGAWPFQSRRHSGGTVIPSVVDVEHLGPDSEIYPKSRRRALLLPSLALMIGLAGPYDVRGPSPLPHTSAALAETVDSPSSAAGSGAVRETSDVEQGQQSSDDVKSWYRYRGEGFVLRIPPGYEDVLEPGDEEEYRDSSSLYGEKAKEKPFAARFASPDRDEVLSIVVKRASQLRLSFFEAQDISDFGNIKDAAPTFVPAGAKLVSARIINSKASRVPRTYYVYEFLARGTHFALTAGVAKGRVFVLGASTPQAKWKASSGRLQLAAATFFLP